LRSHDGDDEDGDDERAFEHELQRCRAVGQRPAAAQPKGVERDEHDGLDGDAAEDIADRDAEVVVERGAGGDRDLRQVRRDGEHDEPAQRLPDPEAGGENVRRVGQLHARQPHRDRRHGEDGDERREPERRHPAALPAHRPYWCLPSACAASVMARRRAWPAGARG
jgi:hypothetical protein